MSYMLSLSLHCIIRKYIYQVQVFQWQWMIILVVRFLSIDICLHSAQPPPSNTNQEVDDTSNCLKAGRCSWCSDCSVWCGALALLQGSWCSALRWCLFVFWSLVYLGFQVDSWLEDRTCRSSPRSKRANNQWGLKIALYVLPLGCEWNFRSKNARSGIPQIGWLETPRESLSFSAWRFHTSNRVSQKWIQWCR